MVHGSGVPFVRGGGRGGIRRVYLIYHILHVPWGMACLRAWKIFYDWLEKRITLDVPLGMIRELLGS